MLGLLTNRAFDHMAFDHGAFDHGAFDHGAFDHGAFVRRAFDLDPIIHTNIENVHCILHIQISSFI